MPTQEHEESTSAPVRGGAGEGKLRLFVAIPLADDVRAEIADLSERLQKGFQFTPQRPSWTHPDSMHLTIAFMGETAANLAGPIGAALARVGERFAPLRIEVKRLGVFPHWRNPRVLWAGLRDRSHQINELHQAVERALAPFGYEPEDKEYKPHLTLARFRSLKGVSAVEGIVNDHQGFKFGPFVAPEMILFQSVLHPSGAKHTPLARARFTQPARAELQNDEEESS